MSVDPLLSRFENRYVTKCIAFIGMGRQFKTLDTYMYIHINIVPLYQSTLEPNE